MPTGFFFFLETSPLEFSVHTYLRLPAVIISVFAQIFLGQREVSELGFLLPSENFVKLLFHLALI